MVCLKKSFCAALSFAACSAFAGPITTVAWNGHPGAATFSFDDGLHSQTKNLTFLDNMPDVKVTFFVCTNAMDFGSNSGPHMEYAKKGHEIGNHTSTHKNLTQGANLNSEIGGAASKLRSMGLEVTSLATPYCAQDQAAKNAINQEHFINRSCGGDGLTSWDREPDWMAVGSHYWQENGSNVAGFKQTLDQAASQSKWHVQLNHGVADNWDKISTADIKTLIEYAVSKKLWVASFSTVGAYLRAHFTIDKATATNTSSGFTVKWTSPHAHMPKSVPLRVKIQGAEGKTVSQKGKVVEPNSDGTYTIEFMALELEVSGAAAQSSSSSEQAQSSSSEQAKSSSSVIALSSSKIAQSSSSASVSFSSSETILSSSSGTEAVAPRIAFELGSVMLLCRVFDMNGQLIKSANVMAGSASEAWNNVKAGLVNGAYILRYGKMNGNMHVVKVHK
ncbi:MAG: polysaccharide deacetylase family protein [Fibrobacter sp.]|nr:polysaccharide deacetylase family protein [Fibrobacter sp.]